MKMTILDRDDEITHIVLTGRLDTTGVVAIEQSFSAATAAQGRSAIVDLSDIVRAWFRAPRTCPGSQKSVLRGDSQNLYPIALSATNACGESWSDG